MRCIKSQPAAVLSITGNDHQDFLQGQGTADLRGPVGFCRYSLWLDFKGRMLGDSHVLRLSDSEMLLVSDATPAEFLLEKFDRHIIADDVEIEDRTEQFTLTSIDPDSTRAGTSGLPIELPEDGFYGQSDSRILFIGRRLGKATVQILSSGDPLSGIDVEELTEARVEALRVSAAMPLLPNDTDGQSLNPIEANIISPLSFSKGCYLGQEVVARVERLGRVSKRLALIRTNMSLDAKNLPLHLDGQPVGNLTSVVNCDDNSIAIGWVKSKIADGNIVLDEGEFTIESLPAT